MCTSNLEKKEKERKILKMMSCFFIELKERWEYFKHKFLLKVM